MKTSWHENYHMHSNCLPDQSKCLMGVVDQENFVIKNFSYIISLCLQNLNTLVNTLISMLICMLLITLKHIEYFSRDTF